MEIEINFTKQGNGRFNGCITTEVIQAISSKTALNMLTPSLWVIHLEKSETDSPTLPPPPSNKIKEERKEIKKKKKY